MRLTVLGKSPSWQDAGGACSGYLIEEDEFALVLDCGNGVFSKLRHYRDYVDVDAVLISHLHADHFLDLVPFSYALVYAPASSRWRSAAGPARARRRVLSYTRRWARVTCSVTWCPAGAMRN